MPVNLTTPESVQPVPGVLLSSTAAGLKKSGDDDMALIALPPDATVAGVFTRNAYCAAPVRVCRDHLSRNQGRVRALLINSGGANAATGDLGEHNARQTCQWVADRLSIDPSEVLPFSTGVIGQQLPMERMEVGIAALHSDLTADGWMRVARAIMTTDTVPKITSRTVNLSGRMITLCGFAKGSGMIQPNMATMLAYLFTDASVAAKDLQSCLKEVVERTFNSITVDGDTSTNDSCMLCATGLAGGKPLDQTHTDWPAFVAAVHDLALELAQSVVRDGEGATKFMTIHVCGGRSSAECRQVGLTVANSPLVKTAFFASDANVGRLIMAIGRAGIDDLDINTLTLKLGNAEIWHDGQPVASYTDQIGQVIMAEPEIDVTIQLGRGDHEWSVWTCDLSHDYVRINADYRS